MRLKTHANCVIQVIGRLVNTLRLSRLAYLCISCSCALVVCGPVYVYRLRKHTELPSMIDSIAMGDPDIRQILDLVEGPWLQTGRLLN